MFDDFVNAQNTAIALLQDSAVSHKYYENKIMLIWKYKNTNVKIIINT